MKTWITYLAALFMGFSTTLLLGDTTFLAPVLSSLTKVALQIGSFVFIPLVLIGFSSGIASLRKDSLGAKFSKNIIFWTLTTSILLPLITTLFFDGLNVFFPVTSTAGSDVYSTSLSIAFMSMFRALDLTNPFYTIVTTSTYMLPILLIAFVFGFAIKPNVDVIKPAYVTLNSFSEVMFRISRIYSVLGYFLTYLTSAYFFTQLYQEKTIFVSAKFLIMLVVIAVIITFIILPLLTLLFTKNRVNPYKVLFRTMAVSVAALTSGNLHFSSPIAITTSRHNLGAQKRVSATSIPLFSVLARGGSAAIAIFSVLTILTSVTGAMPTLGITLIIALTCIGVSFISSMALGYEVVFISFIALSALNIDLYGAEMTMFGLLPLLNGVGSLIDAQIGVLGTAICGANTKTDVLTPYKDNV